MRVPFLDLLRQYHEIKNEIDEAVLQALERGVYILGTEVAAFEHEWAAACGVRACAGTGNGTDAPVLALLAAGIGAGDEVITTPLTAGYTALAIRQAGAVPVFADIDAATLTLDPAAVERSITPKTKALMPVHLAGHMADMAALMALAEKYNLTVIEDCAQSHLATWAGKPAGSFGHAATFSFYPTKNLGAFGDGGAVVSNDETLIERVKLLRQGGHLAALQGTVVGMNSRLDELHAAMLRVKLRHLPAWTQRRQAIAARYVAACAGCSLVLPTVREEATHAYHLFIVQHAERERVRALLAEQGIETLIHYPYLLHQQPLFARAEQAALPVAEAVAQRIFSLPLSPQMTEGEIAYMIEVFQRVI